MTPQPSAAYDVAGTPKKHLVWAWLPALLTAFLSALLIWSIYTEGTRRGMDHAISFAGESEINGMAIAISELKYGLHSYTGYSTIVEALTNVVRHGVANTDDPQLLLNLKSASVLNEAISAAMALGPQKEAFIVDRSLMTMIYDDIGIVDYDKIAFSLFGFKIEAMYYLYFVILSLSSAIFLLQCRQDPAAQAALLATLLACYLELYTRVFSEHVASLWGMRHGAALSIIPLWHLLFLTVRRSRATLLAVVLALLQIAILLLAIRMRGSAAWTLIFLTALTMGFVVLAWRRLPAGPRRFWSTMRTGVGWHFALLLVMFAASKIYTDGRLHSVYFTDDVLPYHGAWHSAYLGLAISPSLAPKMGVEVNQTGYDRIGYVAALAYMRKVGFLKAEGEYISPWTNTYKMRLHDNIMRIVFWDMVKENPLETVALYLYWKPAYIVLVMNFVLEVIPWQKILLMIAASLAMGFLTTGCRWVSSGDAWRCTALGAGTVIFACIPSMWAYASSHIVGDVVITTLSLAALATWALGSKIYEMAAARMSSRPLTALQ